MTHVSVAVSDLYVRCSFQVRNLDSPAIAMSDCCQQPAETAVEMANGNRMFRCALHKGVCRLTLHGVEYGPVWETVWVKE